MQNLHPHVAKSDPEVAELLKKEYARQSDGFTLIPSENHTSSAVLDALSSVLSDKYAEGYPGKRYYPGNAVADEVESLAIARAEEVFGVPFANVQAYSGSPANLAVYSALLEPGESIMGLGLPDGGHLTHGWKFSMTSKFWTSHPYHVKADGTVNFDEMREEARRVKPKIIVCGGTAVPRAIPFKAFAEIADEVGAYLLADVSHIAGLIAGGAHESPVEYAHVVMTTTHKTLRGPRGALILATQKGLDKDPDLGKKINKAIIPGLQGGPHLNTIAGIAIALRDASTDGFKNYAAQIVKNAKALGDELTNRGIQLVSGGTDNHLLLADLSADGSGRGIFLDKALERVGIYANMNSVPHDPGPPLYPSGLRMGTPAVTTRGMKEDEMKTLGEWIATVYEHIKDEKLPDDKKERPKAVRAFKKRIADDAWFAEMETSVRDLARKFPLPS